MTTIQNDYETIPVFQDYVDKYATKHEISVKEALEHEVVKCVWRTYAEKNYD